MSMSKLRPSRAVLKKATSRPLLDQSGDAVQRFAVGQQLRRRIAEALVIELRIFIAARVLEEYDKRCARGPAKTRLRVIGSCRKVSWRRAPPACSTKCSWSTSPKRVAISNWPFGDQPSGVAWRALR